MTEFVFVSGRRCLDFAGTLLWRRTLRAELLNTPDDLRAWAQQGHLIDEMAAPEPADLVAAVALRESVYGTIRHAIGDGPAPVAAEVESLNELARGPLPALTLTGQSTTRSLGSYVHVASSLARDTIELIGSEDLARVKECANEDCTRMFVDHSRGMSRRWCGMAECGNRAKAAMYRKRKKLRENDFSSAE